MSRASTFAVTAALTIAAACTGIIPAHARETNWQPAPCVPVTLPAQLRYTVDRAIDGGKPAWQAMHTVQNAAATVHTDAAVKHSGASSTRVDYRFVGPAALEYVQIAAPIRIPEAGLGLGFWYRFAGKALPIRVRIEDRTGETFQYEIAGATGAGWQFAAIEIGGPAPHWGGDGNGRMDFPCTLSGICVDRAAERYRGAGSIWIDDVAFVKPRSMTSTMRFETIRPRFGCVYSPGETVAVRATATGDAIRWRVTDFGGRVIASGQGSATGTVARHAFHQPGYYAIRFEALRGDQPTESREYRCAVVPPSCPRSSFVGMCTHFGQGSYPLECMDLMLRYGIDQFRDEISWGACEPAKGTHVLPEGAARYLGYAAARKMRPVIIFDYANGAYDGGNYPNSSEAIAGFAAYAAELAQATHGTAAAYEVWNEWIGGCGMGDKAGDHGPEAYGRLLHATYRAVKLAVPGATVVGIGGEYGDKCAQNIATAARTAGPRSMDAFSIHPYRYPRPPEESNLVDEVRAITAGAAEGGAPRNVWVTEIGYPTHLTASGSDERAQARHTVRTLALLQTSGIVRRVFWYDFKDDGLNRDYNEDNFGLVRHQSLGCAPKPAIVAVAAFNRMTAGARFVGHRRTGDTYVSRYRRGDGQDVLMAWTTGAQRKASVTGALRQMIDIMGAAHTAARAVTINANPLYLVGRGIDVRPRR